MLTTRMAGVAFGWLTLGMVSMAITHDANAQARTATQLASAATLEAKGDVAKAATIYKEILRTNPTSAEALNNLAWLQATSKDRSARATPSATPPSWSI